MRKFLTLILMSVFVLTLAACSGTNEGEATENEPEEEPEEAEEVVVENELGETTVEQNQEYINQYDTDEYENVGSLKEPDFEKLAEVDPDLIIISGRQADLYDQLTELAPTIYLGVDETDYMNSFENNVGIIGEIFNKEEEA